MKDLPSKQNDSLRYLLFNFTEKFLDDRHFFRCLYKTSVRIADDLSFWYQYGSFEGAKLKFSFVPGEFSGIYLEPISLLMNNNDTQGIVISLNIRERNVIFITVYKTQDGSHVVEVVENFQGKSLSEFSVNSNGDISLNNDKFIGKFRSHFSGAIRMFKDFHEEFSKVETFKLITVCPG